MTKITFNKILSTWFIIAIVLTLINSLTLKSTIMHSVIFALLGIVLFINPVYPLTLENKYSPKRCIVIVRGIAAAEVILSFCMHTNF